MSPCGNFCGIDGPIAQSGAIVIARAEPAIVHHEHFHAEFGGFGGEVLLPLFVDRESGGLPGVVEHRAEARSGAAGEDLLAREAVEHARGGAEAGGGEAAKEGRRFQGFAGLERVGEIEAVEAAGDAHLAVGGLLDGHAPVAAPTEGAEPDGAVLFAGVSGIDGKPGIEIMAGVALAAFEHLLAFVDGLVIYLGLGSPAAGKVGELIAFAWGQVPGGRLGALHDKGALCGVANGGAAAQDAVVGIDAVMEGDFDGVVEVFQDDIEIVAGDAVGGIAEDEIAVAVLARDFEGGLVIARAAPAGELFGFQHLAGVEGRDVAAGGRRGQIVGAPQRSAPVEMAQRAIGAEPHGVGALAGSQEPDFAGVGVLNRLGGQSESGEQEYGGCTVHEKRVTHCWRGWGQTDIVWVARRRKSWT